MSFPTPPKRQDHVNQHSGVSSQNSRSISSTPSPNLNLNTFRIHIASSSTFRLQTSEMHGQKYQATHSPPLLATPAMPAFINIEENQSPNPTEQNRKELIQSSCQGNGMKIPPCSCLRSIPFRSIISQHRQTPANGDPSF